MLRLHTMPAGLLLAAILVASAQAIPNAPLAPASKWRMDYGRTQCQLLRTFGEGQDAVTLQFSMIDPEPPIELGLVARGVPPTRGDRPATLSTTTVPSIQANAIGSKPSGPVAGILQFRPSKDLREAIERDAAEGQPTRLGIGFVRGWGVTLDLGSMKAPLAALDRCIDDLVASWGLDPAEQRARTQGPVPVGSIGALLLPNDYPILFRRGSGVVIIRMIIGLDGTPTGCVAAKTGENSALEAFTCEPLMKRARFTPAKGAAGDPIPSYWTTRVVWQSGPPTQTM